VVFIKSIDLGLFDYFKKNNDVVEVEKRDIYGQTIVGSFLGSASGQVISKEQAIRVAAVWSCVRVLSETIASLPISLYEKDSSNRKTVKSDRRTTFTTIQLIYVF